MKKLPETVRIAGMIYTVRQVACGDILGQHISAINEIKIDADACRARSWEVLWHEIMHSINSNNHLDLSEQAVSVIATAITQVLMDNPGVTP